MNQINGENNNFTSPTMPIKRKRGRPRKDKSLQNPTKITPTLKNPMKITPTLNYPPPLNSIGDANGSLVGQPVTGVIEASFDAGFLLNVNIGNSGTCLRGVVFKPGHYRPVSVENDVAPHIQMVNRNEIPIPMENRNVGFSGSREVLNNGSLELETSGGQVKPVVLEVANKLPNGSFENMGNLESDGNGISRPNEVNNKSLDLEPPTDEHLLNNNNNNQSQEAPQSYSNSRMGPMSMLLQAVQEKMTKPGGSS